MALARGPEDLACSARGCQSLATRAIVWRNPAIGRKRTKIWLSCDAHIDFLADYMRYRSFPYRIIDVALRDDPRATSLDQMPLSQEIADF
ncbi:hypothetical protein [Schaalia vaccimaxillae]|uniref:hypothetical protein n=1 Tax=Schaalia vaccimaxillae TaxID=183916 RepID=UPI0004041632|nr:hypothetical protein [Schaalia vaccimaxillae]